MAGALRRVPEKHLRMLRRFWGLMQVLVNGGVFANKNIAAHVCKTAVGFCEQWIEPTTGQVFLIPRSIALDSEDATDPDGFFDQVKQFVVQRYCINCDDLSRQVDEYLTSPQVRILGEPAYETTSDKSNFWYSGIASTL